MFELPSKEKLEESGGEYSNDPVQPGNYIVKLAKVTLRKKPKFINGRFDNTQLEPMYETIAMPFKMESGDPIQDTSGNAIKPLDRWIFRDVNPRSIGFQQDKVTPSFMRGLLAIMLGLNNAGETIRPEDFVLLNANGDEVKDEATRTKYIEELEALKQAGTPSELAKQGYEAIPEIRMYEGKYIGASIEVKTSRNGKTSNTITKWNRLPQSFVEPTAEETAESMQAFAERYQKMVANRQGNNNANTNAASPAPASQAPSQSEQVVDETLKIEDVPF